MASPQDYKMPTQKAEGSGRLGGLQAPKISTEFINVIENNITQSTKQEIEAEKRKLDLALTRAENEAERDVLIPLQAKIANTKGLNTLDAVPKTREEMVRGLDKISQKYPEQYRPYLEATFEKVKTRFEKNAIPHMYKETNDAVNDEYKVHIASKINQAVQYSANESDLEGALTEVGIAVTKHAQISGISDAQKQQNMAEAFSQTVLQAVTFQASMGRLDVAENIIKKNGSDFLSKDMEKAQKAIATVRKSMETDYASKIADEAYGAFPRDPALQHQYIIENGKSDAVRRQALAFNSHRRTALEAKAKQDLEANKAKVMNSLMPENGGKMDQSSYKALPTDEQIKITEMLNKNGGRLPVQTNFKAYDHLYERILDMGDNITMDSLHAYRDQVAAPQMKTLEDMLKSRIGKNNTDIKEGQRGVDLDEIKQLGMEIATSMKIPDSKKPMLKDRITVEYFNYVRKHPTATRDQIKLNMLKRIRNNAFTKKRIDEPFWKVWADDRDINVINPDFGANLDSDAPKNSWHPSHFQELKRRYPNRTDAEINSYLDMKAKSGFDLSTPFKK